MGGLRVKIFILVNLGIIKFFLCCLVTGLWVLIRLAEANRSPFDFAEGESELVSGFNTEYRSVIFVIVFLAEYIAIIFISMLTSILFLITSYTEIIIFAGFIGFFYIWARGTLPRFRYDQLIYLA